MFNYLGGDASKVQLHAGDQLAAVGGVSLVDAEDPFERAVELIQASQRPLTLRFIAAATPAP